MSDHLGDFKRSMRRLASTILLITSGRNVNGHAATAVTCVTTEPPTLLIAVNKGAGLHPVVLESGAFYVNLLTVSDHAMVPIFSGGLKGADCFAHGD